MEFLNMLEVERNIAESPRSHYLTNQHFVELVWSYLPQSNLNQLQALYVFCIIQFTLF